MEATDVVPTRLAAAESAANTFIDQLPGTAKVGVVAFSTAPDAVQPPTVDHTLARRVIDGQTAEGSTDTGDALQLAIDLLHRGADPSRSAVVLLSDGAANEGQNPVSIATEAGRENVVIDTVALGTPDGIVQTGDPLEPTVSVPPDPALMRQIATASHGQSFDAQDAGRLSSIYKGLGTQLGSKTVRHDITVPFAIAALVLLLAAGLARVRWAGRLP
jgi:Ca-activated chloride channel family protein